MTCSLAIQELTGKWGRQSLKQSVAVQCGPLYRLGALQPVGTARKTSGQRRRRGQRLGAWTRHRVFRSSEEPEWLQGSMESTETMGSTGKLERDVRPLSAWDRTLVRHPEGESTAGQVYKDRKGGRRATAGQAPHITTAGWGPLVPRAWSFLCRAWDRQPSAVGTWRSSALDVCPSFL